MKTSVFSCSDSKSRYLKLSANFIIRNKKTLIISDHQNKVKKNFFIFISNRQNQIKKLLSSLKKSELELSVPFDICQNIPASARKNNVFLKKGSIQ